MESHFLAFCDVRIFFLQFESKLTLITCIFILKSAIQRLWVDISLYTTKIYHVARRQKRENRINLCRMVNNYYPLVLFGKVVSHGQGLQRYFCRVCPGIMETC